MNISTADVIVLAMKLEAYNAYHAPTHYTAAEAEAWARGVRCANGQLVDLLKESCDRRTNNESEPSSQGSSENRVSHR